jgi:branched-chain amino acid transport system ATP-binding protein
MPDDKPAILEARGLTSGYGGVTVLRGLDFVIGHEIFAVLGANGAGKSTLMKTIAKILPLQAGSMTFRGQDVSAAAPYHVAQGGLAFVPQEHNIFPDLTVEENLSIGGRLGTRPRRERMDEIIELFPDVAARLRQKAGTLSGGEAQMVAVGRALMQEPKLLLLDEPTAGLAPKYVDGLFGKIREIHEKHDVAIVLAEQNAVKTLAVADRVMLLSLGSIFRIDSTANIDSAALKEGYRI